MKMIEQVFEPVVASPASDTAYAGPDMSVWLVDDNDEFRRLLLETLRRQDGINCEGDFSSPDELLSALASKPGPDVILMDVHMGERNGLDAIGPIKALSRNTQVLMLTSMFDSIGCQRALDQGASDFLLKTYTPDEIVARIRNPSRRVNARRRRVTTSTCTGKIDRATSAVAPNVARLTAPRVGGRTEAPSLVKGGLRFLQKLMGQR